MTSIISNTALEAIREGVDRPILFSGPMVRALLDGRKTQTRRILGTFDVFRLADGSEAPVSCLHVKGEGLPRVTVGRVILDKKLKAAVGDRLWVRETWMPRALGLSISRLLKPRYRADEDRPEWRGLWKPGIHMFRWASRLTLTVTDVRVQRLQDISADDADAECFGGDYPGKALPEPFPGPASQWGHLSMPECYGRLWDSINGAGAWDANPWVAAYTFTVERRNIDEGRAELADANPKSTSPNTDRASS
jgi:hypothetical protein